MVASIWTWPDMLIIGTVLAGIWALMKRKRHRVNLLPCRDCAKYISINARLCPHCGSPINMPLARNADEPKSDNPYSSPRY